jgi:hypothetical protein
MSDRKFVIRTSEEGVKAFHLAMHDMLEEEDFIPLEEDPDMKIILEEDESI